MRPEKATDFRTGKIAVFFICMVIAVFTLLSIARGAEDTRKVVRVGWHEEPYFISDENGRWSGYTYDYQRKIAAYTGWKYEYVTGTWSDLFNKLKNGEIDLMGNISFTEERADQLLYASLPMGTEAYYIFVSPADASIRTEGYTSLTGKKIGVTTDTIQSGILRDWISAHGISAEIVELNVTADEGFQLLGNSLDAFVTMDVYGNPEVSVPLWKIGSSDYYFAVNKNRPDILTDLNAALGGIQDENKYFNQELHEEYLNNNETKLFLNDTELSWLEGHGRIRVGYQDNYLAFCAKDEKTGTLTGALKDYLDYASNKLENASVEFETVAYPSAAAAIEALQNHEVDCVFPFNLSEYDSELLDLTITPPLMKTEMDAVVRSSDEKEFLLREDVTVAVNRGNTNYELFLNENYPGWRVKYFADTPTSLDAVAKGEADCVVISNYRFSNIARQCDRLRLATVYTGVDVDYCFAVRAGDTQLYTILMKMISVVPGSIIHAALTYYSTEDARVSFIDFAKENIATVVLVIITIALIILLLLLRSIRAEKKALEEERLVASLNNRVYMDALTKVRNKGAFNDYIDELQAKLDRGEVSEFAIGVLDCDNLKTVNDKYGHDKGDVYLQNASKLICRVFQHSPVFRIGGDEFALVLQNGDFIRRKELIFEFEQEEARLIESGANVWDQVRIAIGVAEYDPQIDTSVNDTARRADKLMYENKRIGKNA